MKYLIKRVVVVKVCVRVGWGGGGGGGEKKTLTGNLIKRIVVVEVCVCVWVMSVPVGGRCVPGERNWGRVT